MILRLDGFGRGLGGEWAISMHAPMRSSEEPFQDSYGTLLILP